MIIKREVNIVYPPRELGMKVAEEPMRSQQAFFHGFASTQLMQSIRRRPVRDLVAILPSEVILWFVRIYSEIVKQGKVPKAVIDYNNAVESGAETPKQEQEEEKDD